MPPRHALMVVGAIVALLAWPALADPAPYFTASRVDLTALLPPPPPADSPLARAELEFVQATQTAATPERIAQAQNDAQETVFDMFAPVLGTRFKPDAMPKTAAFFARIGDSEAVTAEPAKAAFARVRPWLTSSDIKGIEPTSRSGSYPSGHTTRVTIDAIVMERIVPELTQKLWERANVYAESRVVLGMHFPLDLEAGRRAGTAEAAVLFTEPEFRTDLDAVRAEVRAGLGL